MHNQSLFTKQVLEVVRQIPIGQTLSYRDVAMLAGRPGAYRAVGTIMKHNQDNSVPCHRVIRSDGTLGGYNGTLGSKAELLRRENVLLITVQG